MKQHLLFLLLTIFNPTLGIFWNTEKFNQLLNSFMNSSVAALKFAQDSSKFEKNELNDTTPSYKEEYDYVVVGAGSAGSVIAARLSEIKHATVLLIEAGSYENYVYDIPLLAPYLQMDKNINWDYSTEPSKDYCLAMENHQCRLPKGKVMGGSSTINFMIATRGTKNDYDEWAQLTADRSWSYESMLKYFKKLEKHNVTLVEVDPSYHGKNGPVNIVDLKYISPLGKAFIEAGREMDLPPVDYNGQKLTGFNFVQTNQINGERLSTNRAYLRPIKNRQNLAVSLNSHVNKVLINPTTKTAYGVEFTKGSRTIEVRARKEVILSAGAIASSQILMLSGVGPSKHLREFGINVMANLPVGENLLDHVAYPGLIFFINQSIGVYMGQYSKLQNPMLLNYLTNRTGYYTTAGVESIGFVNVDDSVSNLSNPNIELVFATVGMLTDYYAHLILGINASFYSKYLADKINQNAWYVWPILQKPKSRGKILLRSKNPKIYPKILANYYSDQDDIRVMIKAIRLAIKVGQTKAMQSYGSKLHNRPIPGCEHYKQDSDTYWECALRSFSFGFWHQAGTCKMGRKNDPTAVVNSKLQVKGIRQLRVVDASIMPTILTAHHNIPVIAIAEKAADIIKFDHGYTSSSAKKISEFENILSNFQIACLLLILRYYHYVFF